MKSVKHAAIATVVLTLGIVVSYLLGLWGSRPAPPSAPTVAGPARPVVPTTAVPATGATAEPAPPARDDDPRGELRLEGMVLDASERGVGGARVAIDAEPARVVEAESDGSFVFDGLVARAYRLEASAGDQYAGPVRLRLAAGAEPVVLRLRAGGTVEVAVREAHGDQPMAGAEVELRGTLTWSGTTGGDGVATLRGVGPTWGALVVRAAGFAPAATMVSIAGDPAVPARFAFALARGAAVRGRVVDDAGAPIAGARVVATSASEPFPVVDPRRDGVVTDAAGRFEVAALAAGTHRLTASDGVHAPAASSPLVVDGVHPRTGVELVLAGGGRVTGIVTDAAGAPIAGADIRVVTDGHVLWRPRRHAFSDAAGRFALGGLPRRPVDVVAAHTSGTSAIVAVDLAATAERELALVLDVTGAIEGIVVDRTGQPIGDAAVTAEPVATGGVADEAVWSVRGVPHAVTDPDGRFRFVGLPVAGYQVRAARPGARADALRQGATTTARPGDPALRLVLPADGQVTGKVAFADGRAPLALTIALDGGRATPSARSDGSFAVDVVAGSHHVVIAGAGFVPTTVRAVKVEEGKPTDLGTITVVAGRSISGRVLDGRGRPVKGARVAAGPLLTGGGAELYIESESPGARATETDDDGRFVISGFGPRPLTVVAGKDGAGRSPSVSVPRGPDSVVLDLILAPSGAVAGTVTRHGAPVADTVVIANPAGSPGANFFVVTAADGTFAFDALTAGSYVVFPMIGGGGGRPKDMFMRKVEVTAGARAELTIDLAPGAGKVEIMVVTEAATPVAIAQVVMVQAAVTAPNLEQLRDGSWMPPELAAGTTIALYLRAAMGPPVTIESVAAGTYTACAVPFPVADASQAMTMMDEAGTLPMQCTPVVVAGAGTRRVTIAVPVAWTVPRAPAPSAPSPSAP